MIGQLTCQMIALQANKVLKWLTSLRQNTFNDILLTDLAGLASFNSSGSNRCSHTSIPGPMPDRSYVWGSNCWLKHVRDHGIVTLIPSNSQSPRLPSQSLTGIDTPLKSALSPSISNNQFSSAQHVNQILLTASTPLILMSDFKIRHLPFNIPNVHSTSFCMLSSHFDQRISSISLVMVNGGTVHDHCKYPLSTITYTPSYLTLMTLPKRSKSSNFKSLSWRRMPSRNQEINLSRRTIVWSFHCPRPPVVVCRILQQWLHVRLNVRVVWLLFAPRWLFFNQYSHLSVVIYVQSVDPTHPGNPATSYSHMLDSASGKCKEVSTNRE